MTIQACGTEYIRLFGHLFVYKWGRGTAVYYINESLEYILCLKVCLVRGMRSLTYTVFTMTGNTVTRRSNLYDYIDSEKYAQDRANAG